jgi:hypothetical protein
MAIGVFEATYANPINVRIEFQAISTGLGDSQEGFDYLQDYHAFYNALVTVDANPAAVAGLTAYNGTSTHNPVTNTTLIDYALMAVLEHEIDEVLGLGSQIPNCDSSCTTTSSANPAPEDLFRYAANGTRSSFNFTFGSTSTAFFSYAVAVDPAQFNNACNKGDFGDWQSGTTAQVQDAFGSPGPGPSYGPNEIAALSAIGYKVATPEPGTSTLLFAAVGVFVFFKRG